MMLSAQLNKTKVKALIAIAAVLFVAAPIYFADAGWIEDTFYTVVVFLFGGIAGLCGLVLNYAVGHFVTGFADEFNSPMMFATINVIWTLIRDLFNMTFIFGLVYIGFTMILKSDSSGTRKWLINLVIAALLVNFSLLISKLVIDVTNLTATQILNAGVEANPQVFKLGAENEVDFAGSMMQQLGIITLFDNGVINETTVKANSTPSSDPGKSLGYSMMLIILFLITAFTFLSAGILIIVRGAMMILFMVFSPLMFIGFVIPSLMKVTKKYWTEFLSRAFFAPIYILIVYVGMSVFQAVRQQSTIGSAFTPNGFASANEVGATFGPFALFIVLMIASLNIAKQLGVEGATTAMSMGNKLQKGTRKYTARAVGGVGTRAINRVGSGAERQMNRLGIKSDFAYGVTGAMKGARVAGSETASEMGARRTKRNAEQNSTQREYQRKSSTRSAQNDMAYARNQRRKIESELKNNARLSDPEKKKLNDDLKKANDIYEKAQNTLAQNARNAGNEEIIDALQEQQEALRDGTLTKDAYQQFLSTLSDSQFKKVSESGKFNNKEIDEMEADRNTGTIKPLTDSLNGTEIGVEEFNAAAKRFGQVTKSLSAERLQSILSEELKKAPDDRNKHLFSNITDSQLESLQKDNLFSTSEIEDIKANRKNALLTIAKEGSLANANNITLKNDKKFHEQQRAAIFNKSAADAGKLPVELFTADGMAQHYTPQQLEEKLKNGGYTDDEVIKIKEEIEKTHQTLYANGQDVAAKRMKNIWKTWSDKSSWGAHVDLDLKDGPSGPTPQMMNQYAAAANKAMGGTP